MKRRYRPLSADELARLIVEHTADGEPLWEEPVWTLGYPRLRSMFGTATLLRDDRRKAYRRCGRKHATALLCCEAADLLRAWYPSRGVQRPDPEPRAALRQATRARRARNKQLLAAWRAAQEPK